MSIFKRSFFFLASLSSNFRFSLPTDISCHGQNVAKFFAWEWLAIQSLMKSWFPSEILCAHLLSTSPLAFWPSELSAELPFQLYLQHIDFHSSLSPNFLNTSHHHFQWFKDHMVRFRHKTDPSLDNGFLI